MSRAAPALIGLLLLLGCGKPALEGLRQKPGPRLFLELSLPEGPDGLAVRGVYLQAFQEYFGPGISTDTALGGPNRLQLLVVIGQREERGALEGQVHTTVNQASALASGSPRRVLYSALAPNSAYEQEVSRLGYRPPEPTGTVVLLKTGPDGFQETLNLDTRRILRRMRPLGENDRASGEMRTEEGRAVALETLAMLEKRFGWAPPGKP